MPRACRAGGKFAALYRRRLDCHLPEARGTAQVTAGSSPGAVGLHKPDPRIFELAAHKAGCPLEGAWIVGDCPDRDIADAVACGLRSAWLHRGRTWDRAGFHPTVIAGSLPDAVDQVTASRTRP